MLGLSDASEVGLSEEDFLFPPTFTAPGGSANCRYCLNALN